MFFLGLCLALSAIVAAAQRLLLGGWHVRAALRLGLAGGFLFTGVDHFVNTERYVPMMPPFLAGVARELVYTSGAAELLGAFGLLVPRSVYVVMGWPDVRWWAGVGLAILLAAIVPANINVAIQGRAIEGLDAGTWYLWLRPFLQPVIIVWALYAGGVWPRSRPPGIPEHTPRERAV